MIYLELFLTFLQIGLFTFGGGYAMIPLVREKAIGFGLSEEKILNLIAVSESTPGPIAVNMATFIGSEKGGILGSLCATLGVILPSFIIILLISSLIKNLLKYAGVQAFLRGVRPCVVALILSTSVTMFLGTIIGLEHIGDALSLDWRGLLILALVVVAALAFKKIKKKKPSPILLIIFSACLGMIFYSI